ncbi:MAG: winged helix DNA-binding domain-containing protein [Gammaproteobacteria bacterium]|nr:winged helix DNA-binding domain-containing protein [Gammaproteobacteria bacterium]
MRVEISRRDARRLFLYSQGLLRDSHFGRGKGAVQRTIDQLGYVQIDTISVVERAHHHTLLNRVGNYRPSMLDALQSRERSVFEYWFHAAAYLPMSDYRFYQPIMQSMADRYPADKKIAQEVMRRIADEGAMQSRDFDSPKNRKNSGWWDWKPAKRALENLFLSGELMITRREGFQKVYDLRERVLPAETNTRYPTEEEWGRFMILLMVRALGLATLQDIAYLRQSTRKLFAHSILSSLKTRLEELQEAGEIIAVSVAGECYYTTPGLLEQLPTRLGRKKVRFLSPFDNLVINRKRSLALFDFDYQIECYVPAAKRKYGYFCLPILYGDQLIGRMDSKAERKTGVFKVISLHAEDDQHSHQKLIALIDNPLQEFAAYHGCETVSGLQETLKRPRLS